MAERRFSAPMAAPTPNMAASVQPIAVANAAVPPSARLGTITTNAPTADASRLEIAAIHGEPSCPTAHGRCSPPLPENLGYTLDDAAPTLECDRSKISRIETASAAFAARNCASC
jgi:hypothetical protein